MARERNKRVIGVFDDAIVWRRVVFSDLMVYLRGGAGGFPAPDAGDKQFQRCLVAPNYLASVRRHRRAQGDRSTLWSITPTRARRPSDASVDPTPWSFLLRLD